MLAGLLLIATAALTPWFGTEISSPSAVLANPAERDIFLQFRLTRSVLAMVAGASLSLAGCMFQAVLRNSLASPLTLGVSSGAALGAVIVICLNLAWVWAGAMLGAAATLALIAAFALRQRRLSAHTLVLAGVSITSVCSALIILLQSTVGFTKSFSVTMWLIGSIEAIPVQPLAIYTLVSIALGAWIVWKAPEWDLLSMGEAWAAARGADVRTLIWQACFVGSAITAATVSMTGPIGFVGLMVPHVVRIVAGAGHRTLLPASLLAGGAFLMICDTAARTLLRPAEIPVGVITAILGGPGLIWMLGSQRRGE